MIIKIFLFWRVGILILTLLGSTMFSKEPNGALGAVGVGKSFDYWQSLLQWDGGHYYSIAKYGYQNPEDFAFFPLFPIVISLASFIYLNPIFWGVIITNISFLIFLLTFHKILERKYSKDIALNATISLLIFPTAFFTTTFYSEPLFLMLTALSFYFLERNKFFSASLAIAFASLTRIVGVILIISFIFKYLHSKDLKIKKLNSAIFYLAIPAIAITIFFTFLFMSTNNPLIFLKIQHLWGRSIQDPITTILSSGISLLSGEVRPLMDYLDFFTTIAFIGLLAFNTKKIPSSWWAFSLLVILIPASSNTLSGMPRYVLSSLGTFVIIGILLEKRGNLKYAYWALSLFLQVILYIRFINGYWVA